MHMVSVCAVCMWERESEREREREEAPRSDPCIYHHQVKASIDDDILTGFSTVLFSGPDSPLQDAPCDCA